MNGFSFGRTNRLLRPAEFQNLLRRPTWRKARGPLQLLASRNNIPPARLGLIVPKRFVARAVDRNRTKRLIREQFRCSKEALAGCDVVIRVRGPVQEPALQENVRWLITWLTEQSRSA